MIATPISRTGEYDLIARAIKEIGLAQDEVGLINRLISLSLEATGADGASYVPVDENMQPIAVFRGGYFPTQVTDNLLEYIASPSVRQQCKYCSNHEMVVHDCPLLLQVKSQTDPYIDTQAIHHASKIYCLPIRSNNKELGYLNLYCSNGTLSERNTREILDLLSTLTTICLNHLRLTRQVQEAQRQKQTIRQKENVAVILRDLFRENPDNSKATWIDQVEELIADIRYNAMMEERMRLAREIHDGLAQTLGFLKLQIAQMQTIVDHADHTRLHLMLQTSHKALAEAYQDIREAIDGLRMPMNGINEGSVEMQDHWIMQVMIDFQDQLEFRKPEIIVSNSLDRTPISSEVQGQMIRILQEALSNVRKHAQADHVWISYSMDNQDLILEIQDDGVGFTPNDVPRLSQHGLRGMRERSELIGADFQVISKPEGGTTIKICLPIGESIKPEKD